MSLPAMFSWTLAAAVLLNSCALAPARLIRPLQSQIRQINAEPPASLHQLLSTVVTEAPDSPEGSKALGEVVERWKKEKLPARSPVKVKDKDAIHFEVVMEGAHPGDDPLSYFDEIQAASGFKTTRIRHHQRPGIGAPLIALRENKERERIERFFPPEAISRPLTAVAEAGPAQRGVQRVRIRLLPSLKYETVMYKGRKQLLAADFSSSWAAALSRAGALRQSGILDMLTPTPKRKPQLYLMEAYDPQKEPLIMIHGLLSTPLAWADISNDLWADPRIRSRYQIWHYLYNTSAPALYSSRILRSQLKELRLLLDPDGNDPAMQKTTLLVHSMGGLIGKSLIVTPGDAFWEAAFTVPPEQLKLSAEDRKVLNEAFEWQPDRTIHRVIFISTPHRGSRMADNPVGKVGSLLTRPPVQFQDFFKRIYADNPGAFTPAYEALGTGRMDSVSSLSPKQPTLRILADLPIPGHVRTHSIIGNRGWKGPLEKSTDGIVPYTSSRLEGATSELIVPARHGAFRHPAAKAEIVRILHLD
ncbi:alpha/beta hydrolase [Prosthecobacter sp. SYSU 5D2]|uniref:esterase/lipase family protein n=1 Tax=Prosthecobacter sp. SYSU 5D2 TaxID=3134134 RepID=UPI0031FEDC57